MTQDDDNRQRDFDPADPDRLQAAKDEREHDAHPEQPGHRREQREERERRARSARAGATSSAAITSAWARAPPYAKSGPGGVSLPSVRARCNSRATCRNRVARALGGDAMHADKREFDFFQIREIAGGQEAALVEVQYTPPFRLRAHHTGERGRGRCGPLPHPARNRYNCAMETTDDMPGNAEMIAIVRAAIATAGGRIPFAHYMALVLTHPVHGYYASGRGAPGRAGADFLTAPETSPYFGRCLAVQIAECWQRLGAPPAMAIWEPGAGAGTLARTILDALRDDAPAAYDATTYWLDDLSPRIHDRASAALAEHAASGRIAWGTPPTGCTGVVLANEFVDALPVHRVRVENGALREAYVVWDDERDTFGEGWEAPSTPALAQFLADGDVVLAEGQIAEISLAARDWIQLVADRLDKGYVVTIDYGDTAPALYRPGRFPEGSLMCYYRHTANREPYRHVGEQDMTAHVDFSALERAGTRAGLATLGLTTQAALLASLGLGEMLYAATQRATDPFRYINERNAVVRLIEPSAMGRNRRPAARKRRTARTAATRATEPPI